jgi:curved DNA-binding protein CbpA
MDPKTITTWQSIGNLYELLGLEEKTSIKKVKKGCKQQSLIHHPDKSSLPNANEIFNKIRKAYEILSDPIQKEQYDTWLESKRYHKQKASEANVERSKHIHSLAEREKQNVQKQEDAQKRKVELEQKKKQEALRVKREMEEEAIRKKEEELKEKDLDKKSKVYNSIKVKWKSQPGAEYSEDLLRIIFGKYGEIRGVAVIPEKKKAVIEFVHRLSAEKAYEENKQEDKEQLGISDSLKVKLMYKEKSNKKLKTDGEAKKKSNDFSLSSANLSRISQLVNKSSNVFISNKEDEIRRTQAREKYLQDILAKGGY